MPQKSLRFDDQLQLAMLIEQFVAWNNEAPGLVGRP